MTEQPQVRIGKLMPNWMINLTDRIMQYYIDPVSYTHLRAHET